MAQTPRFIDEDTHLPSLAETGAVLAAIATYRQVLGLAPGDATELNLHMAELKQSIERVEAASVLQARTG